MGLSFAEALLVLGLLLAVVAGLSGWLHGTVLSISVLSLGAGVALALLGVVEASPHSETLLYLVELALVLTLFADGLYVESELLQKHWGPAVRALVIALPVTLVLLALMGKAIFPELSWAEAFLLGAVLSPTDPVVTSAVVTSDRIPQSVRHTLNLESGLNDGLALPLVLFFLVLATPGGNAGVEAAKLGGETIVGVLIGAVLATVAGRLLPKLPGGRMEPKYEGAYALGVGLAAFGLAVVTYGNGLVAAFVAGLALAASHHDIPDTFQEFNESAGAVFQITTFFVFGALIVATGWDGSVWPIVLFIAFALFVARPVAVFLSFVGVDMPRPNKLFIAWFGAKGVASMLFALFVLASSTSDRTLIFDIAAFVILASILAHGLTDTVGTRWIERRLGAQTR